jgi:NTP pyrophosphatase (non-canonical NTP hydrolase)
LAISLVLEATEVLEHFQWTNTGQSVERAQERHAGLEEELADVAVYLIELCDVVGVDLEKAILNKLERNAEKYPVDRSRGSSKKYSEL